MDNRLFSFAEQFELESLALSGRVRAPAARPGIGTRVMQGLRGARTRATQLAGTLGEAATSARSAIRAATRIPEHVEALVRGGGRAAVRYNSKTGKIMGAETPEEIAALKGQGLTDAQIRQVRNLAIREHYVRLQNMRAARGRGARQRVYNKGRAMFTKGFSGSHLQGRWAALSPTARTGMIVMTGLTVWYYLFTGKRPTAKTEDGQAVLMDVPPADSPMLPMVFPEIDAVIEIANRLGKTDVIGSLNAAKTALSAVQNSVLVIDNPTSSQAFSQRIKTAETAADTAVNQLDALSTAATAQEDKDKILDLEGSLGEFIIEVLNVRGMQA